LAAARSRPGNVLKSPERTRNRNCRPLPKKAQKIIVSEELRGKEGFDRWIYVKKNAGKEDCHDSRLGGKSRGEGT